jgi:hypothetical protein
MIRTLRNEGIHHPPGEEPHSPDRADAFQVARYMAVGSCYSLYLES